MKIIDGHAMIKRVEELYRKGAVDLSYFIIVREAVQMEPALHLDEMTKEMPEHENQHMNMEA